MEHRTQALALGNKVRRDQRDVKREVRAGQLTLRQALDDPRAQSIRLMVLLVCLPKVGRVKAQRMLDGSGLSLATAERRIAELTPRQRGVLAGP